jgi:hypothetical protein
MTRLQQATLVTTGAQETERVRLVRALEMDSDWKYERDCRRLSESELRAHYRRCGMLVGSR